MLGSLLVAVSLEGQLPGSARMRDPLPVVWYDRMREIRRVAALRAMARQLTRPRRERSDAATAVDDYESATALPPGGWSSCVFVSAP